jgi:type I restriction-modification system DNA methylase subunit
MSYNKRAVGNPQKNSNVDSHPLWSRKPPQGSREYSTQQPRGSFGLEELHPTVDVLLEHFFSINLGNQQVSTYIIGDGYEFLVKKFGDATNKKASEFYTPRSVVRLMVDILNPNEGETV